jgi:hypothetical protein
MKRIIVGISGASGATYGIRLLEVLHTIEGVETHAVLSSAARRTLALETDLPTDHVERIADELYQPGDIAAAISSGSFRAAGMIVGFRDRHVLFGESAPARRGRDFEGAPPIGAARPRDASAPRPSSAARASRRIKPTSGAMYSIISQRRPNRSCSAALRRPGPRTPRRWHSYP